MSERTSLAKLENEMEQPKAPMKKTINLDLVGLDGNAFALLGAFRRQAEREGWTSAEIDDVLTRAKSGDYDHVRGFSIRTSGETPNETARRVVGEFDRVGDTELSTADRQWLLRAIAELMER